MPALTSLPKLQKLKAVAKPAEAVVGVKRAGKSMPEETLLLGSNGSPLVVYHGPGSKFTEFKSETNAYYFTDAEDVARGYSEQNGIFDPPIAANLSIKNPYRGPDTSHLTKERVDELISQGYDGAIGKIDGSDGINEYVVFSPEQIRIKSNPASSKRAENLDAFLSTSVVRTPDGKPLRVYTGTSKDTDFSSFKVPKNGVWFTEDTKEASMYAKDNDSKDIKLRPIPGNPWNMERINTADRVIPVYLDISNPKVYKVQDFNDELYKLGGENYKKAQGILFDKLRAQGYDGVKIEPENGSPAWVVIKDASQIKSALGNTGEFSKTQKNMTKAVAGATAAGAATQKKEEAQ